MLADLFAKHVASAAPFAEKKMKAWMRAKDDFVAQVGWDMLALASMQREETPDSYFETCLAEIEQRIHSAPNRTRHAMNNAMIAIGIRNTELRSAALAVAERIGKVEVDHGETGCKTPDAASYIHKTWQRKKLKADAGKKTAARKKS